MRDAFDCSLCAHSVTKHSITRWPNLAKGCQECDCSGYLPNYRARSRWDDDMEAGAIG